MIALRSTTPFAYTVVGAPLFVNVAVPSGMLLGDQLAGSIHSLGSPPLPPIQVASAAWAAVVISAVLASSAAVANRCVRARLGPVRAKPTGNCEALRPEMVIAESTRHPG
jgi:hypothetical protein